MAGSVDTGNIVGVATALVPGGAGAVFWMWIPTLPRMMTTFSENVPGMKYRIKNLDGIRLGGAMYYLERGVYSKMLVVLFSVGYMLASFGMGNTTQSNSITGALRDTFDVALSVTGLVLTALLVITAFGSIRRIVRVAERLVPPMATSYLFTVGIVLYCHRQALPKVFRQIMDEAFGLRQAARGVGGAAMANALRTGVSRRVFVNEVKSGSSVMAHSGSTLKEPAEQGMWGIFWVFLDTIIICAVATLVILCSDTFSSRKNGVILSAAVFSSVFEDYGGALIFVCISLFAFATLLGWSYYDECGVRYLVGNRAVPAYRILFTLLAIAGCTLDLHLAWGISSIFNDPMAFPNLIALFLLSGEVLDETTNCLAKCHQKKKAEEGYRLFARIRHNYSSHSQRYESSKF